jgi:hypothetical protein
MMMQLKIWLALWMAVALCAAASAQVGVTGEATVEGMEQEAAEYERPEIAARNAIFERLDRAGDGYITYGEAVANPNLASQFEEIDADGDGRVSRAEFAAFEIDGIATPDPSGGQSQQAPASPPAQAPASSGGSGGGDAAGARPGAAAGEDAAANESAPNVLILRAEVATMAYDTVAALERHTMIPLAEPVGWAVFSAAPVTNELNPGTGMARHERGEVFFLNMTGVPHTDEPVRYVFTFKDENLFRQFRQGELDGQVLERARADGFMEAFQVSLADGMNVEPVEVASYDFALDTDLERALIGTPSVTAPLVDEDHVWTHDR